jgi:hypothetical protein
MLTHWQQAVPAEIESLNPLRWDIAMYLTGLLERRNPAHSHAKRTWNLSRDQFDRELEAAFAAIRQQLKGYALSRSADLEFV